MKTYVIMSFMLIPIIIFGVSRTVSLDGTQQYTSIQTAINSCNYGDVVIVYPGRYLENINLNGHSIALASLFAQDPQQTYIDNTIIDGNLRVCIKMESGESATINGFTIVNNEQNSNQFVVSGVGGGGGIRVKDSNATIKNCIIRNCISNYGAGLSISVGANVSLENNMIYKNRALYMGGGIMYSQGSSLVFSSTNLNSIYDNIAALGMDIFIGWMEDYPVPTDIILNHGSRLLSEPDNYFITTYQASAIVNVAQSFFPLVDGDIYVSDNGDDDNNGLSAATPFRTIKHALQLINSNSNYPRTVYLAAGTYSFTSNGQLLPLSLKPHVNIVGAGIGQTIVDGGMTTAFFAGMNLDEVFISDISFQNGRSEYSNPIEMNNCNGVEFRNLVFSNNQCAYTSGLYLLSCADIILENLDIGNTSVADFNSTIHTSDCSNLYINGVISHNNSITHNQDYFVGLDFSESDVMLRNSIIANNSAPDAFALSYQNVYAENSDNNLDMCNVLVYNNSITQCIQAFAPVYLQNRFQTMKINNCTFAGNQGSGYFAMVFGYADLRNLVFYNPGFYNELFLRNHVWSDTQFMWYDTEISISNSLFSSGSIPSNLPDLVTLTDNIMNSNPVFLGSETDTLIVSQPEYYYLGASSPCINTGTADTSGLNLPPMDLAGNYRIWDGRIDMGCYEYGSKPYVDNDDPELPIPQTGISISVYPNPIHGSLSRNSSAFIEFTLPKKPFAAPKIEIFNIKGQKVKTIRLYESYNSLIHKAGLSGQVKQSGEFYSTVWNGKGENNQTLSCGTYVLRVEAEGISSVKKVMLIK